MKTLFRLFIWGTLLFLLFAYWYPAPAPKSEQADRQPAKVTLSDVSRKSTDALTTTSVFIRQEKARLASHMAIILRKLDRMIGNLKMTLASASAEEKPAYRRRLENWQNDRAQVVQLQSRLTPAENSTLDQIKTSWRAVQVEISGHAHDEAWK